MVVQCCVCHRVRGESDWAESPAVLDQTAISHGYCPPCAAKVFEEVRNHLRDLHGPVPAHDAAAPSVLREAI